MGIIAFIACNKDGFINDPAYSPATISTTEITSTSLCGIPIKVQEYWSDGVNYVNTGHVEIANDENNLYITVTAGEFQPVDDNIDIGFYNVMPPFKPESSGLHYHYTSLDRIYYITIPLSEIVFEDGESGMVCGEQIYVVVHTDTYTSLSPDRLPLGAWAGKPWAPYFMYTAPCCITCDSETAWGGNSSGSGKAWWLYFDVSLGSTQNIYSGQNYLIGTVTYDAIAETITINLTGGWVLDIKDENTDGLPDNNTVKIQGYNILPTTRPAAGLFTTYSGNNLVINNVPEFPFYAIHLDVEICE